uniref:C-type lectin domain-containing protein n=1 Tax=Acrobeloides nanus TaxID=290746 RepID=A0A914EA89_9BILA
MVKEKKKARMVSSETHTCPEGYTRFSGKCYKFITEPKLYNEALENCEKMDANLPTINNDEENRFVAYSNSRHAVLFGTKNSPHFWFGNWANMDGKQTKQPYVCATDLINGVYPDIVEPYPSGSNVSVIVSSPNASAFIPPECCTAALPIVIEDATTLLPKKDDNGGNEANLLPIETPPTQVK